MGSDIELGAVRGEPGISSILRGIWADVYEGRASRDTFAERRFQDLGSWTRTMKDLDGVGTLG